MRAFVSAAVLLVACSKDPAKSHDPPKVEHAEPKPAVALATVDAAVTQGVSATALVVVKQDGKIAVVPLADELDGAHDLDLATVGAGGAVTIAELAERVATVQRDTLAARAPAAPDPEAPPPADPTAATLPPCDERDAFTGDADVYGALLGDETGEINGGFGYGTSGFGPGGGGTGWGTIGVANAEIDRAAAHPAGLRGRSALAKPVCGGRIPLVLIDPHAPASTLIEVLTALPRAQVAATTDGGAHARALAIVFAYEAGNQPPGDGAIELGITVGPDGANGTGYRGAKADETLWSWTGPITALGDAYHQGQAKPELLGATFVRVRVEDQLNAGALIEAIAALVGGNVDGVALGEPIDFQVPRGGAKPGRRGPVPSVKLATPTVTGAIEPAVIRRYVRRNLPKISYCYEKQLLAMPDLTGTIEAKFAIAKDGTVSASTAKGVDGEVSSCIADVLHSIEYPKPKDGQPVTVTYVFDVSPGVP